MSVTNLRGLFKKKSLEIPVSAQVEQVEQLEPSEDDNHSRTLTNSSKYTASWSQQSISIEKTDINPCDFEKIRIIGKGDVGRVYLVREKATGNLLAMKVLAKNEMRERKKLHRVLAEQEILATINHPFVVKLVYSLQSPDNLYFFTEYCAGGEFYGRLQSMPDKRIQESEAKFYIAEIVVALEFLHLMGCIYRDLKPENILIHSSGHIKLSDFDLSKPSVVAAPKVSAKPSFLKKMVMELTQVHFVDTNEFTINNRTNSFVGTEEYIAPEIIKGTCHTSNVDWWTLGILFYEMLCGTTPFKGPHRYATFTKILHDDVTFPTDVSVSDECKTFIHNLLIKSDQDRLGASSGAAQIKGHAYFKGTEWALLRNREPPFKSVLSDPLDGRYFKPMRESSSFDLVHEIAVDDTIVDDDNLFEGFESISIHRVEE